MRSSEMVFRSTRNTARVERFSSGYWRIHREQVPASYEDKDLWYSMCMSRGRVATFPTPVARNDKCQIEFRQGKQGPSSARPKDFYRAPPRPRAFAAYWRGASHRAPRSQ